MKAWLLNKISDLSRDSNPLLLADLPTPAPVGREILIRISCCGVCHTELDEIEGRLIPPQLPIIPGHQVVGIVEQTGTGCKLLASGDRAGVAWIFSACGHCQFCRDGNENLCPEFKGTGNDRHGGYAEYMVIDERFAYKLPESLSDPDVAPLLCAGAIGYRSFKLSALKDGQTLGLSGFGASGHLVMKMAKALMPNSNIFVFARSPEEQQFARTLGAKWAGSFDENPGELCDAVIDTTPAWNPIVASLGRLKPGGRLIINAIRKEGFDQDSLLRLRYPEHLWMEKEIKSVANITRIDVQEFLPIAAKFCIKPATETYPFEAANQALVDLKNKHVRGAKVITMHA